MGAKRQHEEDVAAAVSTEAERAAKKARKEKKHAKKEKEFGSNMNAEPEAGSTEEETKALRKAAKKQKKAAAEANSEAAANKAKTSGEANDTNGIVADSDAVAKAEKAARKAAKKAAKAAKTTGTSTHLDSEVSAQALNPAVRNGDVVRSSTVYTEAAKLSALPQSDIDAFVAEKQIAVADPRNDMHRPITSFEFLPVDETQRAPFKAFSTPTPIQAAVWPYLLAGRDVVGVAETGSGKTLAFGVPCIKHISSGSSLNKKKIKACIVSPTRELALQIVEQLVKIAEPAGLKVTCVYGGVSKDDQRAQLKGTNVVVATPGRLNDFLQEGSIDLSDVDYVVLDEADRMLDKGFEQEVRKIISSTSSTRRQTLMFTATWPPSVRDLADTFMNQPVKVTIGDNASGELRANTRIVQEVEVMAGQAQPDKQGRLIQLLKQYQSGKNKDDKILVFCLYKKEATRIEEFIRRKGFRVAGIHGDLSQQKRTESLDAFKRGQVPILVATDVAARGLDIPAVKLVLNVTFPLTVEDYVHRIGRTGRAGQDGKAITFFTDAEKGLAGGLINVLKAANQHVPEDLMKYGTTVKKKGHEAYGAFYKDTTDMKKASKITFD
nr:atp-dependent rna helicase dbp3 [Quercus suber]